MASIKPIVHFVHGNSFPAGTYRAFLDYLREDYDIRHLEMHGHHPQYPVRDGWRQLEQELIETLQTEYKEPVDFIGAFVWRHVVDDAGKG